MRKLLLILFSLVLFVSIQGQVVSSSVWFAPASGGGGGGPEPTNMVSNGTFDSATGWTIDATFSIAAGVCNVSTMFNAEIYQAPGDMISAIADATDYTVEFDLAGFSAPVSIQIWDYDLGDVYVARTSYANGQTHSIDFTTNLSYNYGGIRFVFQSASTGTIDNIVLYER